MNKTLFGVLLSIFLLCGSSWAAFSTHTSTGTFNLAYATTADRAYDDFDWTWLNQDNQQISVSFSGATGGTNIMFRMALPETGPYWLQINSCAMTDDGTNTAYTLPTPLSASNIPPTESYFAEFILVNTGGYQRTIARGIVNTEWSLFSITNSTSFAPIVVSYTYTGNVALVESDPVYSAAATNYLTKTGNGFGLTNLDGTQIVGNITTNAITNAVSLLGLGTGGGDMIQATHDLTAHATNFVAKTGDTMTGQLTVTTNICINAGGTQWYIGSAPDQFWLGNAQIADWSGGLVFDATNYDLKIDGAFIGSAAKLTSFPDTLATLAALGAEITNRIGADTALSNGLAGVGAGATSLVSAAKTDASNQFVNVGGDTMTGPLVASNIYSVGAMRISADGVLTLSGGNGVSVEDPITFEEPLTGLGWGLSGIPISGVSGLSTALESKVSSVAILPTLTVADLSSVGTNLCTGFTTQTGTLGGVKITNIYANIAAGKTYAWGLGLESTYIGTSWLTCASFSLTNSSPGTRVTNYFSMATSTDRVVLTISSVAGMAQIVTNVFVCEVRTGTVWIAGDARVGGDIIAANYGHNIPLMTNVEDVAIGKSAAASGLGVAVGGYANGQADGTAVGKSSEGYNYGSSVGYMANGINYGAALGFFANAESCGVALGRFANGAKSNIAIGASAKSVGSLSISIGHNVTNSIDNSAALRGTLYLDGGTGVYYRSTFGTGAWLPYGSGGGGDMTQVVHDATAHATNYLPRTGGTMSGGISNDVGFFVDLDSWKTGIINFGNDGYIKLNGSTKISIENVGNLVGPWMANGDFTINGTGFVDHTLSVSGAVTAASYDDGTNSLDVGLGTWNGQAIIDSGASPDLTYLSNGVNSWIASSNDLAFVTNDYPAGTLGIVASSDGGTTLYLKAEATAGAELDPIAGVGVTNNALSIQAVGVVATNAQSWAVIASNAAAVNTTSIQTVGVVATNAQTWSVAASNLAAGALTKTNRWTPATAVCSTGTVQFSPGADNLYTYLPTNPFTVQMAYGVTEVGTVRFEVQASTCTITWGASIKNSGRDSSTNLTMSTTTNMSFLLDKRYGESKSSIYQIGL